MLNIGLERFAQMNKTLLESERKTYIQSFEDLCSQVSEGRTVYFTTDKMYGTIESNGDAKVTITVATEKEVDRIEGTTLKLQNVYFYLKKTLFLLSEQPNRTC
ncbi:hypothetical protein [Pseudalkalibacillus sp. R45]|uniref:hypothetical protein n=1 Tax=Pseudalkalibacillus sp. R45 TaxID=3457433 RepID=UPI003FCD1093